MTKAIPNQKPFLDGGEWADVLRLPRDFEPYTKEELIQRPAASHGKTAFLQLHFEYRNGKTHLIRNFSGGHQIVRRTHYMDPALGDMAVVFIQACSAGVLQGDRIRTEIIVGDGARALITTTAATKCFEMDKNYASQRIDVTVGKNAYCEVMMDPLICYKGARVYNETNIEVDPTGTLVYSEHMGPGRAAHGEIWDFERLYSRLRVTRPTGELIVADTNVLTPQSNPVTTSGLFGDHSDMAVMFVVSDNVDAASLADSMHDAVCDIEEIVGSASVLPSGVGAHARTLGNSMTKTEGSMQAAWTAARQELLGVDPTPIYRTKHGFEATINKRTLEGEKND